MAEYIEREALFGAIGQRHEIDGNRRAAQILECILEAPAADVAPVVHGKWYHTGEVEWSCTNCGNVIATKDSWECPTKQYCDECGARMDGGEENEK